MEENTTIRIIKVLRELNISLERAVEFLKRNKIFIDQNPNAKINEYEYSLLKQQYESKTIPNSIKEIEQSIGIILIEKSEYYNEFHGLIFDNFYVLNENNEIIRLDIYNVKIQNISFLKSNRKISYLSLRNCDLKNIEPISLLRELKSLHLQTNDIGNYYVVKKLTFLKELSIADGTIVDFDFLPKQIEILTLKDCNIKDLNFLRGLKSLRYLDLSYNSITDISPLKEFENISDLDLSYNKIVSINGINKLNSFDFLYLNNNKIEDISILKDIQISSELHLGSNEIIDLTPLYYSFKKGEINFINAFDNPLIYPPQEVVIRGENEIVQWFDKIFENIEKCKQKIDNARQNGKIRLDIGMMGLTDLSLIPNLFEFENLEELILSNHYAEYKADGEYWEKIESDNDFYPNNILNLPNDIKKLKNLKKLIIGGDWKKGDRWNRWRIKDITPVFSLKKLELLNASNNKIERITVGNSVKLNNLKIIHLNNNKLNTFYTLTKFPNLEELYLSNNELTRVTNLESILSLKTIDLHRNNITSIRPLFNLLKNTKINISNSKWDKQTINIQENPLKEPNYETINTGKEAVIRYFESEWKKVINKEIKLILVGNSEVGKTTLVKYLDNEKDLDKVHEATHWMIEKDISSKHIIKKLNEKCNIRVFDFGGQDYYHDTHHIFFTGNTVYLLLWEKSTNNLKSRTLNQKVNGKERSIETQDYPVKYWLDSIKHFIKEKSNILQDSKVKYEYNSNLLLIQNKVSKAEEIESLNNLELKSESNFLFIYDFINIDILKDKRNLGHFDNLLSEIINEMEVVGSNILEYQDIIRKELNKYTGRQILNFNEFILYCNNVLPKNISADEAKDLCSYLKQLGLIFYLPNYSKIYLDKNWVLENIYKILDGLLVFNGEFDREYIEESIKLNSDNVLIDGLLDLMFEFKIIFHNPLNDKYIAPLYLPKEPSEGVSLFLLEKRISYRRFEYNGFIHKTIILDFFYEYGKKTISDEKKYYYWKDGLIIKDDLTSQILYIKFNNGNEHGNAFIDIFKLNNEDKKDKFVTEVIKFIKDINNKFFKLDSKDIEDKKINVEDYYEEMVTINNKDFVSLKLLNENEEKGKFVFSERKMIEKNTRDQTRKDINLVDYKQFLNNKNMVKKIFISYSKYDNDYKDEFVKHLVTLKDENLIDPFNCDEIDLGENSHEVIQRKLAECDYMVALVSVDYMNTNYIREFEIDKAQELGKKIIPIIIKPCDWETSKLGKYHATLRGTDISLDKVLFLKEIIKETTQIERAALWVKIIKEIRKKLLKK